MNLPTFLKNNANSAAILSTQKRTFRWDQKDCVTKYDRLKILDFEVIDVLQSKGRRHLKLAMDTHIPNQQWHGAEFHFRQAQMYFGQIPGGSGEALVEIHLQEMFFNSGQKVNLDKVIAATKALVAHGEMSGVTGIALLGKLLSRKRVYSMIEGWNQSLHD